MERRGLLLEPVHLSYETYPYFSEAQTILIISSRMIHRRIPIVDTRKKIAAKPCLRPLSEAAALRVLFL